MCVFFSFFPITGPLSHRLVSYTQGDRLILYAFGCAAFQKLQTVQAPTPGSDSRRGTMPRWGRRREAALGFPSGRSDAATGSRIGRPGLDFAMYGELASLAAGLALGAGGDKRRAAPPPPPGPTARRSQVPRGRSPAEQRQQQQEKEVAAALAPAVWRGDLAGISSPSPSGAAGSERPEARRAEPRQTEKGRTPARRQAGGKDGEWLAGGCSRSSFSSPVFLARVSSVRCTVPVEHGKAAI